MTKTPSIKTATPTSLPTPPPARVLSICLGQEPKSLFIYADASSAAKSILMGVYDRSFGANNPNTLSSQPSLKNGGVKLAPVQVKTGDLIVDAHGSWTNLAEGVSFKPAGCSAADCAQTYSGSDPVQIDQLVVSFKIQPGLKWSDGVALSAEDSVYSYEVARSLFPAYRPDVMNATVSYAAVDATTVEWKGLPGYQSGPYASFFFSPLPRHAWGNIPAAELVNTPIVSQTPLGWGPYVIDEWTVGDHISLHKNPLYTRSPLPFDKLVYRFVPTGQDLLDAIQAGECDLADETTHLEFQGTRLLDLQKAGKISLYLQENTAWEQVLFAAAPVDPKQPDYFGVKQVRQAVAYCTDRQRIVHQMPLGNIQVAESYIPASDPLYNSEVEPYKFDPQKGMDLLTAAGWIDADNDPSTPRIAQGAAGVPGGTPFVVSYLLAKGSAEAQQSAQVVKDSLAKCGIQVNLSELSWEDMLASGPDGPVFGRHFDLAQFGWSQAVCSLFTSAEIPGPYPDFPKGWGGANAAGYSSQAFDQACSQVSFSLPDSAAYSEGQKQAQKIFAEDLPALPLYFHSEIIVTRPDLCGITGDTLKGALDWKIETLNYAGACIPGS